MLLQTVMKKFAAIFDQYRLVCGAESIGTADIVQSHTVVKDQCGNICRIKLFTVIGVASVLVWGN